MDDIAPLAEQSDKISERWPTIKRICYTLLIAIIWIAGLLSTVYLVGSAIFLLGLAAIFGFYAPFTPALSYIVFVGTNAIPVICFAIVGTVGLKFWLSKRYWVLGLMAILAETALAIYVFVDPEGILKLTDLPLKVIHWIGLERSSL